MRRLLPLLAVVLAAAATAAGTSAHVEASGRLTVFGAASLTDVLPKIDPRPRYGFGGSDQLAYQIQQGAG